MNKYIGSEPFVLFVLENKTLPQNVLEAIGAGLKVRCKTKGVSTGGARGLKENVLILTSEDVSFDEPVQFTGWHAAYQERRQKLHGQEEEFAQLLVEHLKFNFPDRGPIEDTRAAKVQAAQQNTIRQAETLRNPVALTIRWQTHSAKVLVLHAPGPRDGKEHMEGTAQIYGRAVLENSNGFDLIIGDFNLTSPAEEIGGFVDQSMLLGATTKGAEEPHRQLFSRLDRVYARRGLSVSSMLVSDTEDNKKLTDHHCLMVRIESREQKRITDYLQYDPSSRRRQPIGSMPREPKDPDSMDVDGAH